MIVHHQLHLAHLTSLSFCHGWLRASWGPWFPVLLVLNKLLLSRHYWAIMVAVYNGLGFHRLVCRKHRYYRPSWVRVWEVLGVLIFKLRPWPLIPRNLAMSEHIVRRHSHFGHIPHDFNPSYSLLRHLRVSVNDSRSFFSTCLSFEYVLSV